MASTILPFHILGGVLALVFGYAALYASKGGAVHRRSGMLFVCAMVTMSLTGALIGAIRTTPVNVIAGLLTFYFVATGFLAVRRGAVPGWIAYAGVMVALIVGVLAFSTGAEMARRGRPEAAPMFMFGVMALLGGAGDVRVIRSSGIEGRPRIKRHLWRMCFAMWVAAASFFWGPPNRVPEIIRIPALLPVPVLIPVAMMFYWLWKMRRRRPAPTLTTREQIAEVMP